MRTFLANLYGSFVNLLYPPLCLHCSSLLEHDTLIFCEECLKQLELIDPLSRCPYCFSELPFKQPICEKCKRGKPLFNRMAAVFDYVGPAATLIKRLKYADQPYLAEGAGAYLALQFYQLNWPLPDCIVPMPLSFMRVLERGYNQSFLLAKTMGKLLNRPVVDALRRKNGVFSQAGQNFEQRQLLKKETFSVGRRASLQDQCILLIDDVMTTGRSLNCCAEILLESCPLSIYALTLCRTIAN